MPSIFLYTLFLSLSLSLSPPLSLSLFLSLSVSFRYTYSGFVQTIHQYMRSIFVSSLFHSLSLSLSLSFTLSLSLSLFPLSLSLSLSFTIITLSFVATYFFVFSSLEQKDLCSSQNSSLNKIFGSFLLLIFERKKKEFISVPKICEILKFLKVVSDRLARVIFTRILETVIK
jgi:hypothetical protein